MRIYVNIYVYIYVYTYIYIYTDTHTYIYIYVYTQLGELQLPMNNSSKLGCTPKKLSMDNRFHIFLWSAHRDVFRALCLEDDD